MNKKDVLKKRLVESNLTVNQIIETVDKRGYKECAIIIYITQFEGLGNKNSDYDVYVMGEREENSDNCPKVEIRKICNSVLDIEYYDAKWIDEMFANIDCYDTEILKFIYKFREGVVICNKEYGDRMRHKISRIPVENMVLEFFSGMANAQYDDAVKMYKAENYVCGLMCARRALDYAIGAYNTKKGIINLNEKWIPQIVINNRAFGNDELFEGYMSCQIYNNITEKNIKKSVERTCEFVSSILFKISLEEQEG